MNRDCVFISYNHEDKKWLDEINKNLKILEYTHEMIFWDDSKIGTGKNWRNEIDESIQKSRIAIFLVSSNFLASEFIIKNELPKLLHRAKRNGVKIISVILDICAYHLTALEPFQCLNDPQNPLSSLKVQERKRIYVKLATELSQISKQVKLPKIQQEDGDLIQEKFVLATLIIALLVKNGSKTITEIQKKVLFDRKNIVEELRSLKEKGYIQDYLDTSQKKPPSLWKATEHGLNLFAQFDTTFASLTV